MKAVLFVSPLAALALAGCVTNHIPAAPVSQYGCSDGTRLSVRLLGDRARVSVNGARAIVLPVMGSDGTTFSNGRQTLTIRQGQLSWGLGRAMPVPCRGG